MEEEKILEQNINIDNSINVEESADATVSISDVESANIEMQDSYSAEAEAIEDSDNATQDEIIEYIDVKEQEPYVIEVDEAFASTGDGDVLNHAHLTNRDLPGQHPVEAIDGLKDILGDIQSLKNGLYASGGGLAEFRQWEDKNPTWENRTGYFVSVTNGDGDIAICDKQVGDVYGVVVSNSALCGYEKNITRVGNPLYAVVCLVGEVKVRVHEGSNIKTGDYVVADNYGYAIKSDSNIGFRVLSVGTDPILEHYASIALVPQNDNVSRVMKELSATNGEISNVIIQLGKVEDALIEIEKNSDTAIEVAGDAKDLADILNEAVGSMGVKLDKVTDIANQARDSAERAVSDANAIYTDATATAKSAKKSAESALGDLAKLQDEIKPLATWSDGEKFGTAGFVAQANSERTQIGILTTAMYGDNVGTIGVIQEIDRNKTVLKHIVADADKYSVGPYSLSYRLTHQEACGILKTSHIYVATEGHDEVSDLYICSAHADVAENTICYFTVGDIKYSFTAPKRIYANDTIQCNIASRELFIDDEIYPINIVQDITDMTELQFISEYTYSFESGKSYMWREDIDNPGIYIWAYNSEVYFNPPENPQEDVLWFCLNGVTDIDSGKLIYYPETLYRWDGTQWISVATIDGNLQARTIGLMKQQSNELTSTYTNLRGDVSVMKQTVDNISTTVENVEGELSTINQAADSIIAGTYDPEGSSSLSMLLDYSFKAVSEGRYHTRLNSFAGMIEVVGNRYNQPPSWSEADGKFVFNDSYIDPEGKYYFNSDNQTTYCKDVKDGYEVYTIGNIAISALDSRVSETESEMDSWTRFKTGTNETMTSISQSSSEDAADIASVVYGNYRQCVEIKTELTDEEKNAIPTDRYDKAPNYADSVFVFDGTATTDGKYYMLDGDNAHYYKVINPDGVIIGYEKYTIKTSNYASIMQKVDENGSVIGLVANNNDVEGGVFVTAINNSTTALISADKIGINGTAIFRDNLNDGSTTISGSYIRTGVLQSNNYLAPSEGNIFAQTGTLFNLNDGTINSKNFDLNTNGDVSITGRITATSGYIGNGVNGFTIKKCAIKYIVGAEGLTSGNYYFEANGDYYSFNLENDLAENDEIILSPDDLVGSTEGSQVLSFVLTKSDAFSADALPLNITDVSFYYLSNGQLSLNHNDVTRGTSGVYVAPDGIGLGNGNFYVDAGGNVNTYGNVTMYGTDNVALMSISKDGLALNGSIGLSGNIHLIDGSITWNATNSPVLVLYGINNDYDTPNQSYAEMPESDIIDEDNPEDSVYGWHKKFATGDLFAIYSYDGGNTWTEAVKIQGVDGKNGENGEDGEPGSDADVTYTNIKNALEEANNTILTYITGNEISSPNIYGGNIYGSRIYSGEDRMDAYIGVESYDLTFYSEDYEGEEQVSYPKLKIGLSPFENSTDYPYILLGLGSAITNDPQKGFIIKHGKGLWIGDASLYEYSGADYPNGRNPETNTSVGNTESTGIFFNFENHTIYKYEAGKISKIGSGSGGTTTAVFG